MSKKHLSLLSIFSILLSVIVPAAPAASSLVSKFQAQSPTSIYIPANQPVPAQGSTVTFAYDISDYTGLNATQNYNQALQVATTATVTYVIENYGYTPYPSVGSVDSSGARGYLVLLDFGSGQSFTFAYVGYVGFSNAATSITASGVDGAWSYTEAGAVKVWLPSGTDITGATGVIDSWRFTSPRSITSTALNQTLDCSKLANTGMAPTPQSRCSSELSSSQRQGGILLTLAGSPATGDFSNAFIGLVGKTAQFQSGLVQSSNVTVPSSIQGGAISPSTPTQASSAPKYSGPEFSSFGPATLAGSKLVTLGKKLDTITSMKINGMAVTYKINSASELEIDLPKDLAPGKYDVEINSSHGKLTHLQGITIKAVVPTKESAFKAEGAWFNYGSLLELTNIAKKIGSEYNSVKCIVNAADPVVAERLAKRACSYIEANRLRGKAVTYESKSSFKGDGFWVRVVANG